MVAEQVLVQGESVQQRVACGAVMRRVKTRPRETHCKPVRISPSISAEMLTIAVCTHAGRADVRRWCQFAQLWLRSWIPETNINGNELCENLDECGDWSVVRAMETTCVWELDASDQCGKGRV